MSRSLEPNETRADHNRAAHASHGVNNSAAVRKRAQRMDMWLIGARNRQAHRLRTRRQQQTVKGNIVTACEDDVTRLGIDRGDLDIEPQIDVGFGVKTVRAQRQPILLRTAGEIILR